MTFRATEWQTRAACAGWLNFADWPARQQLEVCAGCPVTGPCAELGVASTWSIEVALRGPIYGGMEPKELAALVRARGRLGRNHEQATLVAEGTDPASTVSSMVVAGRTRGIR